MTSEAKQQFQAISVKRASLIEGDHLAIVARYGPNGKEEFFTHHVRGQQVQTTRQTKQEFGKSYRLCIFPGWRYEWVNEGNIRSKKIPEKSHVTARVA